MSKLQVFSSFDPLLNFKLNVTDVYDCIFLQNENINGQINIGTGTKDNIIVEEKIITDGYISLDKKNPNTPLIVWKNNLIRLDNGLSISINISNATYLINRIRYGNEEVFEITLQNENEELMQRIIEYIYNNQLRNFTPNSIALYHPSTIALENYVSGKPIKEVMDFKTGKEKTFKKSRKRKNSI